MNEQEQALFLSDIDLIGEGLALASAQTPTHARMYQRVFERLRERATQLVNGETAMQQALGESKKMIEELSAGLKTALEAAGIPKPEPEPEPEPEPVVAVEPKSE